MANQKILLELILVPLTEPWLNVLPLPRGTVFFLAQKIGGGGVLARVEFSHTDIGYIAMVVLL
ncbi:MAG: hypothetical protein Q9217_002115 [Psora testacea]